MKLNHEISRNSVCVLCFEKTKSSRKIHKTLKQTIVECFLPSYNEYDEIYPKVLCAKCYMVVYRRSKGKLKKLGLRQ